MAWAVPRTWFPGELVTAGMMNIHIRDNSLQLRSEVDTMGQPWYAVPFDARNFYNTPGVLVSHVVTNRYTIIGKTLIWILQYSNGPIPSPASPYFYVYLPPAYGVSRTIDKAICHATYAYDNVVGVIQAYGTTGAPNLIAMTKVAGGNWQGTVMYMYFTAIFELTN